MKIFLVKEKYLNYFCTGCPLSTVRVGKTKFWKNQKNSERFLCRMQKKTLGVGVRFSTPPPWYLLGWVEFTYFFPGKDVSEQLLEQQHLRQLENLCNVIYKLFVKKLKLCQLYCLYF